MSNLPGRRSGRELMIVAASLLALTTGCVQGCTSGSEAKPPVKDPGPPKTGLAVLERVIEAYHQADRYQDKGRLLVHYVCNGAVIDESYDFSLVISGPNRLRMRAYDALVVCDGRDFYATLDEAPGEVLNYTAPEELSPLSVYRDVVLGRALNKIVGSVPLSFFLDPKPLPTLLFNAETPDLDSPEKIDGRPCYRVRVDRREGAMVLWIDQRTFVVRRVEYPTGGYHRLLEPFVGFITGMTITAELKDAELDPSLEDAMFHFSVPKGAELVKRIEGVRMGAEIPKFKLRSIDGGTITRESLVDKVVVLKFWQLDNVLPYYDDLVTFQKIIRQFQDKEEIVFLTVNTDPEDEVSDEELAATLAKARLALPVARMPFKAACRSFGLQVVPTTVLLGRDSSLQDHVAGAYPNQRTLLPKNINVLFDGGDLVLEAPEEPPDFRFFEGFAFQNADEPEEQQKAAPGALVMGEIAPPTEPDLLRRTRLWTCSELKEPGNMLVVHDDGGDRLFVIEGSRKVAEIGGDGKVAAWYELDLPNKDEAVTFLRTAVDGAGRRFFLASRKDVRQQQVHLFDADWNRRLSFPIPAVVLVPLPLPVPAPVPILIPVPLPEQGKHPGIADALLTDLEADGELEMLVGYLYAVGIHCVNLQGERIWRNPAAETVLGMDVTAPNLRGERLLLVAEGLLLPIEADGQERQPIALPQSLVRLIYTADLDRDGNSEWCAIVSRPSEPKKPLHDSVVGLSPRGEELWSYDLPIGVPQHISLDMMASGSLLGDAGQWTIAAADGSIHILGIDGDLVDHFNYGAAARGMAIANLDGRHALVVATDKGVEACQFELPGQGQASTTGHVRARGVLP